MLTGRSNGDRRSILVEVSGIVRPDLLEEVFEAIRELDCHPIEGETSPDQAEAQAPLFNVAATLTVSEIIDPGLSLELALAVAERIAGWRQERNMSPPETPAQVRVVSGPDGDVLAEVVVPDEAPEDD
jgi:hypothetical protein